MIRRLNAAVSWLMRRALQAEAIKTAEQVAKIEASSW